MSERGKFSKHLVLGILGLAAIFVLDMLTPLGVAVGVLYAVSVYLILKESKKVLVIFSLISIILLVAKVAFYYQQPISWMVLANRAISVLAILLMTSVAIKRKNIFNKRNREREEYIVFMEELLAATSHKVRAPVVSCMGLIELITKSDDAEISGEEAKQYIKYLKKNAMELDNFTRDLTVSIHKMKQEKERKAVPFGD